MPKTDYATLIFGGVAEVKWLLVEELKQERERRGVSPEEFDAILNFGPEWPKIAELEADPNLLTNAFLQKIREMIVDRPDDYEEIADAIGINVIQIVKVFLDKNPAVEKLAVEEFQKTSRVENVTLYTQDSEGETVTREGHPNSLPPKFWAETHILISLMRQLDSVESAG